MTEYKRCRYFSDEEVTKVHQASLRILTDLGVRIDDPALRLELHDMGCSVNGDRICFSYDLIEKMLDNIKNDLILSSLSGIKVVIKPGVVVTHPTGGMPNIIDLDTGKLRYPVLDDTVKTLSLMNKLDQIDLPSAYLYPNDVPPHISQIKQCEYLFRYSEKPFSGPGVSSPGEAKFIVELFQACSQFGGHCFPGLIGISPESPLYYPKVITDTMRIIIAAGIPTVMLVAPIAGISSPLTIAGGVAQLNANMLAFAIIANLINPETPIIYGARLNFPNMRSGNSIWGLPEMGMAAALSVQLASFYGFLSDVYGLSCSSCTTDSQSGHEKTLNTIIPMLAGANIISGLGSLGSLTVASYEQLVIDNEFFAAMRRVCKGTPVNDDTLGLDVIADVVAGGNYLAQEHTVRHLRGGEKFMPQIGHDGTWQEWELGGMKDIRAKAGIVARELIDDVEKPELLPKEVGKEFDIIIAAAEKELVK